MHVLTGGVVKIQKHSYHSNCQLCSKMVETKCINGKVLQISLLIEVIGEISRCVHLKLGVKRKKK